MLAYFITLLDLCVPKERFKKNLYLSAAVAAPVRAAYFALLAGKVKK